MYTTPLLGRVEALAFRAENTFGVSLRLSDRQISSRKGFLNGPLRRPLGCTLRLPLRTPQKMPTKMPTEMPTQTLLKLPAPLKGPVQMLAHPRKPTKWPNHPKKSVVAFLRGVFVGLVWEGRRVPTKSLFEQEPPKLKPRSVRPNEVFENLACRICPE